MIAEKKLEMLEKSSAKLTVTVDKETARIEYASLLEKYSKTAQIKGFRRGKVPAQILERKFGESIRSEAGMQLVESSLEEAFKEIAKQPLQFEPPTLEGEVNLNVDSDFVFTVTYDVFPDITLGEYTGIEVEQSQVAVSAEDVDRELEQIRDQNAIVADKPDDASVDRDDIVTIDFAEIDETGEIESTKRQDFTFTIGTGYNRYQIDDELLGMKKDEQRTIEKSFDESFDDEELKGRTVKLSVTLKQVKRKELPELDDELAKDVSERFETLDDLKNEIERRLKETVEARIRQQTIDAIVERIVESSTIELPESMIRAELESSWRTTLSRSRVDESRMLEYLQAQDRTKEDMLADWRPNAERSIRSRLLLNEIKKKEEIVATDEELDADIKERAEQSNTDIETARENIERAQAFEMIRSQIADQKLFDFLIEKATIKKGSKTSLVDLLQENQ